MRTLLSFYRTYKELKPTKGISKERRILRFYRTYKELKLSTKSIAVTGNI